MEALNRASDFVKNMVNAKVDLFQLTQMPVHPSLAQLGYMQGGDGSSSLTLRPIKEHAARCNAANDCRCGVDPPPEPLKQGCNVPQHGA